MYKFVLISLLVLITFTSFESYEEVANEELPTAFIINSSWTFKGYYYLGSDNEYDYFKSKWDFNRDRYFKIPIGGLTINEKYKFNFGEKELKIDVITINNKVIFAQNDFCKLYIIQ